MLRIRTVLFPTDPAAWPDAAFAQVHALRRAAFLAASHGAELHVLTVSTSTSRPADAVVSGRAAPGTALRSCLDESLAGHPGLLIVEVEVGHPVPSRGILDYARHIDADLIVMATHGRRGLPHLLLGSAAEAVVREASCPVLTLGPTARDDEDHPARLLVPLDFSDHARHALRYADALARLFEAELHVLHIAEELPPASWPETRPPNDEEERTYRLTMRAFLRQALGADPSVTLHVVGGDPTDEILAAAERLDAGLVVLATHGRTGLRRLALGSVTERVVQRAPCPVFTVKGFGKSLLPPEPVAVGAQGGR